jgi:hypothetical protein
MTFASFSRRVCDMAAQVRAETEVPQTAIEVNAMALSNKPLERPGSSNRGRAGRSAPGRIPETICGRALTVAGHP